MRGKLLHIRQQLQGRQAGDSIPVNTFRYGEFPVQTLVPLLPMVLEHHPAHTHVLRSYHDSGRYGCSYPDLFPLSTRMNRPENLQHRSGRRCRHRPQPQRQSLLRRPISHLTLEVKLEVKSLSGWRCWRIKLPAQQRQLMLHSCSPICPLTREVTLYLLCRLTGLCIMQCGNDNTAICKR
jgi:hypothetical protein